MYVGMLEINWTVLIVGIAASDSNDPINSVYVCVT